MDRAMETPAPPPTALPLHPPRSYLPMLFGLLMSATIFEGYDITIFHLCTPDIARTFALSNAAIGLIATIVRMGGLCSFGLVASADLYGRKPMIALAVFLYAVFTLMTAVSRGMLTFTMFQTSAQLFLAAEFGIAVTMISEEFPDRQRGRAIAALHTVAFFGVAAAGALYGYVAPSQWGWRGMYFLGIAPLLLTIVLRRGLRETMRFRAISAARAISGVAHTRLWPMLADSVREISGPYRARVIMVAILWNSIGLVGGPTITFFSLYARREHNWSAPQVGFAVVAAYLMGSVGSLLAGWAMDRIGRRVTTSAFYICAGLAMATMFRSTNFAGLMIGMIATMFAYQAARTAASALSVELFPTEIRASGYSLTVQVLGQFGWALSPIAVGLLAGPLGGLGKAAAIFAAGPFIGVIVVLGWIPETRGKTLEEISPPAAP
ncbi:MAG TPA: MFS transporter [Candidatus Binataceae bacterium]|nr:MFS transporter [Candidatus Binataceae bacterium]